MSVPLCVDLDGSLIHTDLLFESALVLLGCNPLYAFAMLAWLLRGKANLKRQIARRCALDVSTLPYNLPLVAWLEEQRRHRDVILCTASDAAYAEAVAEHLGVFASVMASDGTSNLAGKHKAARLVEQFGDRQFDYAGNGHVDVQVWRHARQGIVVNASASVRRAAEAVTSVDRSFERSTTPLRTWSRALRLHQWLKNALVFLPLLAGHRVLDWHADIAALIAFVAFGLCASGVYLLNDLLDLASDRRHPRKRERPFAAGALSLPVGLAAAFGLTIAAFMLAVAVAPLFAMTLGAYYVLTLAYSFRLKRIVMLDVVVLAALYTVRIVAGAAAIAQPLSFWLLAFSMFIFLSLAMLKRYTELQAIQGDGRVSASGRGYHVEDLSLIQSMGPASGFLSVLVLALYINSTASEALYHRPEVLWLLCPLLLYWISRIWIVAHRGAMHDDPVVYAVVDPVSRIVLTLGALVVIGAL